MAQFISHPGSRRGVALVMVLWLMTIVCAIALEVSFVSHLRFQATQNSGDGVRALFYARAGVEEAIAELKARRDEIVTVDSLREDDEHPYHDVEIGEGTYTLLAERIDALTGELEFGITDEGAKVNLNTADQDMLEKALGIEASLAAEMIELRQEYERFYDIGDLLMIESVDEFLLYGEDQNRNGILDPNEDDGEYSWPPDDADGELDRGLAPLLTCFSAARNVTSDGQARVDITRASAQEIARQVQQINQQQAASIVEHRSNRTLASVGDLLDVMLVETSASTTQQTGTAGGGGQGQGQGQGQGGGPSTQGNSPGPSGTPDGPGAGSNAGPGQSSQQTSVTTTNERAFSMQAFRAVVDAVTTSSDGTLQGAINANTASVEVLACLPGVTEEMAVAIADSRPEEGFSDIGALLDVPGMTTETFKQISGLVSVRSDVFSVRSFGVVRDSDGRPRTYCCVRAVIDRTGDTVKLMSWQELR